MSFHWQQLQQLQQHTPLLQQQQRRCSMPKVGDLLECDLLADGARWHDQCQDQTPPGAAFTNPLYRAAAKAAGVTPGANTKPVTGKVSLADIVR